MISLRTRAMAVAALASVAALGTSAGAQQNASSVTPPVVTSPPVYEQPPPPQRGTTTPRDGKIAKIAGGRLTLDDGVVIALRKHTTINPVGANFIVGEQIYANGLLQPDGSLSAEIIDIDTDGNYYRGRTGFEAVHPPVPVTTSAPIPAASPF